MKKHIDKPEITQMTNGLKHKNKVVVFFELSILFVMISTFLYLFIKVII